MKSFDVSIICCCEQVIVDKGILNAQLAVKGQALCDSLELLEPWLETHLQVDLLPLYLPVN
jgi:hypothetical protein